MSRPISEFQDFVGISKPSSQLHQNIVWPRKTRLVKYQATEARDIAQWLQRTKVWFPASTGWLTAGYKPSSFVWPLWALQTYNAHTCKQSTNTHQVEIEKNPAKLLLAGCVRTVHEDAYIALKEALRAPTGQRKESICLTGQVRKASH